MWLDTNAAKFPLAKLERDAATLILRASLRNRRREEQGTDSMRACHCLSNLSPMD